MKWDRLKQHKKQEKFQMSKTLDVQYIFFASPLGHIATLFSGAGVVSGTPHPAGWDTHITSSQFAQSVELPVGSGLQDPQQLHSKLDTVDKRFTIQYDIKWR